jgi:hypothetical protein
MNSVHTRWLSPERGLHIRASTKADESSNVGRRDLHGNIVKVTPR